MEDDWTCDRTCTENCICATAWKCCHHMRSLNLRAAVHKFSLAKWQPCHQNNDSFAQLQPQRKLEGCRLGLPRHRAVAGMKPGRDEPPGRGLIMLWVCNWDVTSKACDIMASFCWLCKQMCASQAARHVAFVTEMRIAETVCSVCQMLMSCAC